MPRRARSTRILVLRGRGGLSAAQNSRTTTTENQRPVANVVSVEDSSDDEIERANANRPPPPRQTARRGRGRARVNIAPWPPHSSDDEIQRANANRPPPPRQTARRGRGRARANIALAIRPNATNPRRPSIEVVVSPSPINPRRRQRPRVLSDSDEDQAPARAPSPSVTPPIRGRRLPDSRGRRGNRVVTSSSSSSSSIINTPNFSSDRSSNSSIRSVRTINALFDDIDDLSEDDYDLSSRDLTPERALDHADPAELDELDNSSIDDIAGSDIDDSGESGESDRMSELTLASDDEDEVIDRRATVAAAQIAGRDLLGLSGSLLESFHQFGALIGEMSGANADNSALHERLRANRDTTDDDERAAQIDAARRVQEPPLVETNQNRPAIVDAQPIVEAQPVAGPSSRSDTTASPVPKRIRLDATVTSDTRNVENDDELDSACLVCYEEYSTAGEHRLVSLKCGHFFGKSCIERWIRNEGRTSGCPTCKVKAGIRDIRCHFSANVKMIDTTELESLKVANRALTAKNRDCEARIVTLESELVAVKRRLGARQNNSGPSPGPSARLTLPQRFRIFMEPLNKRSLKSTNCPTPGARAIDFNGENFVIGVASTSLFQPFGIRYISRDMRLGEFMPLHTNKVRFVAYNPFSYGTVLTGGEDKKIVVHTLDNSSPKKEWNLPNNKPAWSGCWTSETTIVIGVGDGRVWEFNVNQDEAVRDLTEGDGRLPIIHASFDIMNNVLYVASMKRMTAIRNGRVFTVLSSEINEFDHIRSICFDETHSNLVAKTSTNGTFVYRRFRVTLEDNGNLLSTHMGNWQTASRLMSTVWTDTLFTIRNDLFSLVYIEDFKKLVVHAWSGQVPRDYSMSMPKESNAPVSVSRILTLDGSNQNEKIPHILTDSAIYSVKFSLKTNEGV